MTTNCNLYVTVEIFLILTCVNDYVKQLVIINKKNQYFVFFLSVKAQDNVIFFKIGY